MNNIEAYRIPQHLDDPDRFLFWTKDEAAILVGSFILGVYFQYFIGGIIGGVVVWLLYRRIKRGATKYDLLAAIYWCFPHWLTRWVPWLRGLPRSDVRFWIG